MNFSVTQQSFDNVGFRSSTQPTPVLCFSFNPSVLQYNQLMQPLNITLPDAIA
ncbi:hypothetical protein H6G97_36695 [Nostoc flagelliforme FACHB-838]|uniref:Uncharacterized protein n=1 Tax=Nostoc flagelliforme FACHB-838 TaxID=2692904 RepID=A0ABR8DZT2_9NOSO|nr:hypothetical protein [Nostoc flagelliforme]MBD2534713.1 hypothetical protein [Nostoc flagelliforme FACHB-838]